MAVQPIRFEDGAAYERMMGIWSRIVGNVFLDWLAPRSGLRWVDIGCGNGAFTEMIVERCAPAEVQGIDPSEGQLAYARTRLPNKAQFRNGQAMALPYSADSFDVATMALEAETASRRRAETLEHQLAHEADRLSLALRPSALGHARNGSARAWRQLLAHMTSRCSAQARALTTIPWPRP